MNKEIQQRILEVISDKLQLGEDSKISIRSIEVDKDAMTVQIELLVETSSSARTIADGYFGLTSQVRDAMGEKWTNFFPVISPSIVELHA